MILSGSQKVAVFLLGIGREAAAEVMRQMDKAELARVLQAMHQLRKVDQETVDRVFQELHELLQKPTSTQGGQRSVQALMDSAFGGKAAEISKKLGFDKAIGLPVLDRLSAQQIADFLQDEHPQTAALVVAHLSPIKFRDTLKLLPADRHTEVISRVAKLENVQPETLEELNSTLESIASQTQAYSHNLGGANKVAALINALDADRGNALLDNLAEHNPQLAEQVRQLMFTFEDLARFDLINMAKLLKQVDRKDLMLAMKIATPKTLQAIYESMSQRARDLLKDDFASLGPIRKTDAEAAQRKIAELARKLIDDGTLQIIDPNEYVA